MEKRMLSVIVPVYNTKEYLEECIISILEQTYHNFELILIDDGSTDGSAEICDRYAKKDERIKVVHKKNEGVVAARKTGVQLAEGGHICWVDSDDWIDNTRFRRLKDVLEDTGADMVYSSGMMMEYEETSVIKEPMLECRTYCADEIRNEIFPLWVNPKECFSDTAIYPALWMWAIRADILKREIQCIDDHIYRGEDVSIVWLSLLTADKVTFISNNTYHYRQRKTSIMGQRRFEYQERKNWYQNIKEQLILHEAPQIVMQCLLVYINLNFVTYDYERVLQANEGVLYPYSGIHPKSRLVVYGAGKIGRGLMRNLLETKLYHVALWVDRDVTKPSLNGYAVSQVEDMQKVEFDYVVIAVMSAKIAAEISHSLLEQQNIPAYKVKVMDASVLNENVILKIFPKVANLIPESS